MTTRYSLDALDAGSVNGRRTLAGESTTTRRVPSYFINDVMDFLASFGGEPCYWGDKLIIRYRITDDYNQNGAALLVEPEVLAHLFPGRQEHCCTVAEAFAEYERERTP
jgi:hypothetical protein